MGEESRKKRIIIIIRNRVKTICSQTSFGEHNNVQNTSSVGHNTQRNSSVEQMVVNYHIHITEKSRQRSALDNPSTVDPGYQIQDSGSFYYNTISSENSSALLAIDNMSQNWESIQSTIHSNLPYVRRSRRIRNLPNRYGD